MVVARGSPRRVAWGEWKRGVRRGARRQGYVLVVVGAELDVDQRPAARAGSAARPRDWSVRLCVGFVRATRECGWEAGVPERFEIGSRWLGDASTETRRGFLECQLSRFSD